MSMDHPTDDEATEAASSAEASDQPGVVSQNVAESRFEVTVADELAGFSQYKDLPESTQRIFYHTDVFSAYGGRGLASVLTRNALETSVADGWRIVPVCPYVKKWLTSHHDFDDAVDAVRRHHLEALR